MIKKILLFLSSLFIVSCSQAQQTNTIYQNLATNSSAITAYPVRGIGQSSHLVSVHATNAPSHSCLNPSFIGAFKYSYDNVNFLEFGNPNSTFTLTSAFSQLYIASGAFPFVEFNVTSFDNTNCVVTINYSGSLYPFATSNQGFVPYNAGPIYYNGVGTVNGIPISTVSSLGVGLPLFQCNFTSSNTITASMTGRIVNNTIATATIQVCSIYLIGSAASSATITQSAHANACASGTSGVLTVPVVTTSWSNFGQNTGLFVTGLLQANDLCLTAGSGGNVSAIVTYALD